MTYIEFFDKTASKNIATCLTAAPERVILIGDNGNRMKKHTQWYTRVFLDRDQEIDFTYRSVSKSNLDNAVELLQHIVDEYDDCVFDITGGEEILNLALGIVYANNPDKNIQIHKFNLRSNVLYDCDKDGKTVFCEVPALSARDNIRIYGGDVIYGDVSQEETYLWELTDEFLKDVENIWSVCRENPRRWNTQIGVFAVAEQVGTVSEDGLTTVARRDAINARQGKNRPSCKVVAEVVDKLEEMGLISFSEDRGIMTVSYKNLQVKRCLVKAGQALEMRIYIAAKQLEKDGAPVYNDVLNGAVIDWDGQPHDEETEGIYDTENEIDVLLMHGIVPVFISCKNGTVTTEELYKLNTVAQRFGGEYAKKVLVVTTLTGSEETVAYFRQRAKDMHIRLLEEAQDMDDATLADKLKNLWRN